MAGSGYGLVDATRASSPLSPIEGFDDAPQIASSGPYSPELVVAGTADDNRVEVVSATGAPTVLRSMALQPDWYPYRNFPSALAFAPDGGSFVLARNSVTALVRTADLQVQRRWEGPVFAVAVDAAARHLAIGTGSVTADDAQELISYPLGSTSAVHGADVGASVLAWGRDGALYSAGAAFDQGPALTVVRGWQLDPVALRVEAATTSVASGAEVSLTGRLRTTDGTTVVPATVAVTRSGPDGTVPLPAVPVGPDGAFRLRDRPVADGGFTYRARWGGDLQHDPAVAQASVTVGRPVKPRPGVQAEQGPTTVVEVDQPAFGGLVVDDLHGQLFLGGGQDSATISVLDRDGRETARLPVPAVCSMSLSPDSTTLYATSSAEPVVVVLDTATLREVARWWVGPWAYRACSNQTVGQLLAFSSLATERGGIHYLDLREPTAVDAQPYRAFGTGTLAVGAGVPDRLVMAESGGPTNLATARATDLTMAPGPVHSRPAIGETRVTDAHDLRVTPDGGRVLLASSADGVMEFEASALERVGSGLAEERHPGRVLPSGEARSVDVTSDGRWVAISERAAQRLSLWSAATGTKVRDYDVLDGIPRSVRFSGDGRRLYSAEVDHSRFKVRLTVLRDPLGLLPLQLPLPPLDVAVDVGPLGARVRWQPSADDGGSAVTAYTVTLFPGGASVTVAGDTTQATLPTVPAGTYTATVTATNRTGTSRASTPSPSFTTTAASAIDQRYASDAGMRTLVGEPVAPERGSDSLRWRDYQRGRAYWSPTTGVRVLTGPVREKFLARGGHPSLGVPETDVLATPDTAGRYAHFSRGGSIYWTASTGAHVVEGAIRGQWAALGWETGPMGYPVNDEAATPDGAGRFNHFSKAGSIYWSPSTGAHGVWGGIRRQWAALGWETGPMGYPVNDEAATPDGAGRFNHFSRAGSIYWSPSTGAHGVWGAIRGRWAALGWERSYLGYPRSSEHDVPGGRANRFENGSITWSASTGAVVDRRD